MTNVLRKTQQYQRWISSYQQSNVVSDGAVGAAGRCCVLLMQVPQRCQVQGITMQAASPAVGSVRAGLYGPCTTVDDPTGAALVAQSSSHLLTFDYEATELAIGPTWIEAGQYAAVIEFSDATCKFFGYSTFQLPVTNMFGYFDQAYGALPATLPAFTKSAAPLPVTFLRVA
jgi:hypothetical protein